MQGAIRRIGLIGGITWGATADYYRRINLDVNRRFGGQHSADMVIRSLDLHPLLQNANDIPYVEGIFHDAGCALHAAGAQVLAVASFTGHRYIARLARLSLPLVDLIAAVGSTLRARNVGSVAVWATSYALADAGLLE